MASTFTSRSPIDGSIVWSGNAVPDAQIESVMRAATEASRSWRQTELEQRIEPVQRYAEYLTEHQDEVADLIVREVGKLPWDARGEVAASIAKVKLSIQAIRQRRDTTRFDDGARVVRYQPLGVVLVLGPFNFPLHLPGGQIIPALLAGNAVVFKPSDQATAVGQWISQAWEQVGLPSGLLQMIPGKVETAIAAIDSPEVSGVFLTGSRAAGRAIHRQLAGRPDVLLALELGGNNPIVVNEVAPEAAANVISFSAFISSGQRCTCARRAIFVSSPNREAQIDALVQRTESLRVGMPGREPAAQIGPLVSTDAADSLEDTYQQLLGLGCQPLIAMERDAHHPNLVRPGIVDAGKLTQGQLKQLGEMEWFGPLLVIQRAESFDDALQAAADTPYGLAASLLGGNRSDFETFVNQAGAGVVNWNRPTTGAAGALPFGGLGDSGNHRPAGFYAIDFCNDPVASLESEHVASDDPWMIAK